MLCIRIKHDWLCSCDYPQEIRDRSRSNLNFKAIVRKRIFLSSWKEAKSKKGNHMFPPSFADCFCASVMMSQVVLYDPISPKAAWKDARMRTYVSVDALIRLKCACSPAAETSSTGTVRSVVVPSTAGNCKAETKTGSSRSRRWYTSYLWIEPVVIGWVG